MKFSFRSRRKRQRGFGIAETFLGLFLGFTATVGGAQFLTHTLAAASTATVVQDRTTMVTEALNRTSQNIQVADPILYAAPDQLMTKSVDGSNQPVMTRFVKSGNTFYQQSWTGYTGSYMPDPGLWIPVTTLSAAAPNGDGTQTTTALVTELATGIAYTAPTESPAAHIFGYANSAGAAIDTSVAPLTTTARNTVNIKLVTISLASTTEDPSFYQNSTSAAPRNTPAGVSDGSIAAPACPVVDFGAASTPDKPVLNWTTVKGAVSYDIYRNSAVAANVPVPDTTGSGTWTDTTNPAGVADSTTYKVVAKTASGTATTACRSAVWRPQIGLPVLSSTSVQPAGSTPAAWTGSPLTKPRVVFNWAAVAGTSGYELLYREVDPATGNQIGSGAYTNIQLDSGITTYTWDNGGWGKRYEWYLKADARSGQSSESRHIQVLTHPSAPDNATVTASYKDDTDGTNDLAWTAVSSATSYDIWRYNAGTSGAVTLVGSTSSLSYSDTVPYGSTYTYYVAARNSGPRGTDAAGNDVSGDRSSPSPESAVAAADKSAKLTQLQYPPIPDVAPLGAASTDTRDYDGYNRVIWAPAASATGYKVGRFTISAATLTCLTGTDCNQNSAGTTATQFDDPAGDGSQSDYAVLAYNPTGMSRAFSAKVRLTQRPAPQTLKLVSAPSLTDNTADFSGIQAADGGNAAGDKFCTPDTCSYNLIRNGTQVTWTKHSQSDAVVNFTADNVAGSTNQYQFRSRNAAITNNGYSDMPASTTVKTYPGPFSASQQLGTATGSNKTRYRVTLKNADDSGTSTGTQNQYTTIFHGSSAGATSFSMKRVATAYGRTSSTASVGLPSALTLTSTDSGSDAGNWAALSSPGATYDYTVSSVAANGLVRPGPNLAAFRTPPDVPRHGLVIVVCSKNITGSNYADHPDHLIASRLINFDKDPLYGDFDNTQVQGISWAKGSAYSTVTNSPLIDDAAADPTKINSGPGMGYYYGIKAGFRVWTNLGTLDSTIIQTSIENWGVYAEGCGPAGGTWYNMYEPVWACYGYTPTNPVCQTNDDSNRPQWTSF